MGKFSSQPRRSSLDALQRIGIGDRDQVERVAGRIDRRLVRSAANLLGVEAERGGDGDLAGGLADLLGQDRQGEAGVAGFLVDPLDDADDDADLFLETHGGRAVLQAQHNSGADGGMAGEGQLHPGREDAHGGRMALGLRLLDEHGLREIELGGNGLHLVVEQAVGLEDDRERIALEALGRKDVHEDVVEFHHMLPGGPGACCEQHPFLERSSSSMQQKSYRCLRCHSAGKASSSGAMPRCRQMALTT